MGDNEPDYIGMAISALKAQIRADMERLGKSTDVVLGDDNIPEMRQIRFLAKRIEDTFVAIETVEKIERF